jgi:flagellar assembly protein FliH
MSSRARRIADPDGRVRRFDWVVVGRDAACAIEQRPGASRDSGEPGPPAVSLAEQQAHLASLEREAFAKGYAAGERAGVEAGAKRADAMLRRVAQTLEDLARLRKTMIRETERQMVQLALTLARRVVTRELSLEPDLVAAMAHVALERLGETAPATIRLNPDDYASLVAHRGDRWEGAQVTVVPDPAVARGGCLVESDFGLVDASLDAQFDELSRTLLGDGPPALAQGDPGER